MPTFSQMDIYPPKSWEKFESVVMDVFQMEYPNIYFQKYGRQGQAQYGVDICGMDQNNGRIMGIQCKNNNKDLSMLQIEKEIKKAEGFSPEITEYFIVTKLEPDSEI